MSKDSFKSFARVHPELASSVLKGNATWQQLYELYEIYGEDSSVWNNYLKENKTESILESTNTIKDFINNIKNIDMESVQKGITNIQKTIGLLQDIGLSNKKEEYKPKPIYKRFED